MYNFYPDDLIEEVRINNDIVDVVSEYVKLERKGKDYFGLCPFHKEKTPSFSVVPGKQIFYCFGCGKGGNVFNFIMGTENLDYIEAVKLLAERARIQLPEGENDQDAEKARTKKEILKINVEAAKFFHALLNENRNVKGIEYLKKRGISEGTIKKFGLGYSSEEWDSLYKHLVSKSFSEEHLKLSGLVLTGKNGNLYDRFRSRIMFPIFDVRGNVIGFGGRVLDGSLPKYMNSPETPVYNKGRNLYALNTAKNSGEKRLIIVEGYMDVISLHQSGINNAVASLGTALTESQGRILKKYAEEIVISYDADTAGQSATMRGLNLLNDIGCSVRVLIVPDGKDPDEFIRKNSPDAFRKLVDNSLSLVEYKIRILKKEINTETTEGKIKFLNKIADLLAKVDNNVERAMYSKKLANEYEISEESILTEIYKRVKPKTNFRSAVLDTAPKRNIETAESAGDEITHYERRLIAFLCIDNNVYNKLKERLEAFEFENSENKEIAEVVFERIRNKKGIVPAELMSILKNDFANEFAKIMEKDCNCEDNSKAVLDIIKKIEIFKIDERKKEILKILSNRDSLQKGDVEKLTIELNSIVLKRKAL